MTLHTIAQHISTDGMDAHTWAFFALALGPPLLLMVVVAVRLRQDFREDASLGSAPEVGGFPYQALPPPDSSSLQHGQEDPEQPPPDQ